MAIRLNFQEYKQQIKELLLQERLPCYQAELVSEYMATVDFFGISSHGAKTLKAHISKIRNGAYNLTPNFVVEKQLPAVSVINGDNAIGIVSAVHAVDYAIEKAEEAGVYTVFSHSNNTLGAAFYYVLNAAKRGYVCFAMSNSPAQMAPIGGRDKLLGTNPFAVAIPGRKNFPLVVDMATSVVAKSKFNEYKKAGKPLPEGWALDSDGNPTTDPDAALAGLVLPMSGFKGYGIALMIDALAGLMGGARFLDNVGRFYTSDNKGMGVGFSFSVVSPKSVYGEAFYDDFDKYIEKIRKSHSRSNSGVILPGDDRIAKFNENTKKGIELVFE